MTRQVVCDASAVVALLLDSGPAGEWAARQLRGTSLAAPSLMPFETANIIRRHQLTRLVSPDQAAQAHRDLLDLTVDLWPYEVLARRAWELRQDFSIYDASYVALAERLAAPLVTLDERLQRASGSMPQSGREG